MKQSLNTGLKILLGFAIFSFPIAFSWVTLKKGFSKTYRIISFVWLAFYIVALVLAPKSVPEPVSELKQGSQELKVLSVSDFDFTMNERPAVSISIGENKDNYCSISIDKEMISTQNISLTSEQNNNRYISADCNWNENYYVQSSKHNTKVSIISSHINYRLKTAVIEFSINLVNSKGYGNNFEINGYIVLNNTKMFNNFFD